MVFIHSGPHRWRCRSGLPALVAAAAAGLGASLEVRRRRQLSVLDLRSARTVACSTGYGATEVVLPGSAAVEEQVLRDVAAAFPDGSACWISLGDVQRMLVATEGDRAKAAAKLKEAVHWKTNTLNAWRSEESLKLKTAETRVIGLGHDLRPLVYSGCVNQRPGEVAGIILACVWDLALQEAGPKAQLDYVLDAHGYQPLLNMNILPYLKVARSIDSYFAERFHKIVIIDVPRVLVWVIKAILPLMPVKTRQKVVFVSRSNPQQMESLYDLCVDEDMKKMLVELLRMNGQASSSAGREATHELTNNFLESQRSRNMRG